MVDRSDRKGHFIDHDAQNDQARALAAAPAARVAGAGGARARGRFQAAGDVLEPRLAPVRRDAGGSNGEVTQSFVGQGQHQAARHERCKSGHSITSPRRRSTCCSSSPQEFQTVKMSAR